MEISNVMETNKMTLDDIVREVRALPVQQRKELIGLIVDTLTEPSPSSRHSILELAGLGAEIWKGIDAQEYVDRLRDEWDSRP
jgi:hypothetical protein